MLAQIVVNPLVVVMALSGWESKSVTMGTVTPLIAVPRSVKMLAVAMELSGMVLKSVMMATTMTTMDALTAVKSPDVVMVLFTPG